LQSVASYRVRNPKDGASSELARIL
jgi:hypothetical protein